MFQSWRLKLREAEEAYRGDRLDEASRILTERPLCEFRPAQKLLSKVTKRLVQRGQGEVSQGESLAGWRDLEKAQALGAGAEALGPLRQDLVDRTLAEVTGYLEAGDTEAAVARLDGLAGHGALAGRPRRLRQAALKMRKAQHLARQGRFADVDRHLAAAAASCPDEKFVEKARACFRSRAADYQRLSQKLHKQLTDQNWNQVVATSQELLNLAPEDPPALDARRRAWAAAGTRLRGGTNRVARSNGEGDEELAFSLAARPGALAMQESDNTPVTVTGRRGRRFVLWVDAIGGFLVCCGDEITLGQPVPGSYVDVPILGDVSRHHARILRDGEGYLIEPLRQVRLNGKRLETMAPLADGDLIDLGAGVQLRFRRPHALSATARLEFVSPHRTQPRVDAVLLMAESCVLGPGKGSHVVCPDWKQDVVLFGQQNALFVRTPGKFEVDGSEHEGQAELAAGSHVSGEEFSLSLEEV